LFGEERLSVTLAFESGRIIDLQRFETLIAHNFRFVFSVSVLQIS